jgi:phosphoribosylformylglycinamidine (FGAM) synthase PurS component
MWVVGVGYRDGQKDPLGENTKSEILGLGVPNIAGVKTLQTYVIEGDVAEKEVEKIGRDILADNVIQYFSFDRFGKEGEHIKKLTDKQNVWVVEVFFRPGVMDAVGLSVEKALEVIGIQNARSVRTGTTYVISGNLNEEELKMICEKCLANGLIQNYRYHRV